MVSERFDEIMAYSPGHTGLDTIHRFLPELTAEQQDAIYKRFAREEITRTAGRMAEVPGAPVRRSSSWARASPRPTRASPGSRTSPGSPSPSTSTEPGASRGP